VQSKLDFATALSHLGQANYEKAAVAFLRLGSAEQLGDWMGKVRLYFIPVTPSTHIRLDADHNRSSSLRGILRSTGSCVLCRVCLARLSRHRCWKIPSLGFISNRNPMFANSLRHIWGATLNPFLRFFLGIRCVLYSPALYLSLICKIVADSSSHRHPPLPTRA